MASSVPKILCDTCKKRQGIAMCPGCKHHYCDPHWIEHRQVLAQTMDRVGQEHDLLKQELMHDAAAHPLLSRVDQWEKQLIKTIQSAANQARDEIQKWMQETRNDLQRSLDSFTEELQTSRDEYTYTEIDFERWAKILQELREKFQNPSAISIENDHQKIPLQMIKITRKVTTLSISPCIARWEMNALTVAGGQGEGNGRHQLNSPCGLYVDEAQTVYIADYWNHRILSWKAGTKTGEVLAGGNSAGDRLDQLNYPTDVIVDRETDSLLICDRENRRVMRWPRRSSFFSLRRQGEIVIDNIYCCGLTMDNQGSLYVSDNKKNEVRRYDKNGDKQGTVVAGGHGNGANLDQLNWPTFLFVDAQLTLYVSDHNNHRVMKWTKEAKEGIVVAGGNGEGDDLTQLPYPKGVWVDESGHVYVVDCWNNRVMRWEKGAKKGTVIVGGNGEGAQWDQLARPEALFFDRHGQLYVSDFGNHRIQRFACISE